MNYYNEFNSTFVPAWQEASRVVDTNELNVTHNYSLQWIWSNTLNYSFEINKHSLNILAGMEAKKEFGESLSGYGRGLVIEDLDYRYLDAVTSGQTVGNNASEYALVSYFAK